MNLKLKGLSTKKRVALGCFVIPIVTIWLLVLLVKCTGGGDEKKEDNTEKKESALVINKKKLTNITALERQKILAELFKYKEMGTIWSKENNFCSQDVSKKNPWNNSMTMGSNRYTCSLDVYDENSMIYALTRGIGYHSEYDFYNSTLNGVYINVSDKNGYIFKNKEDALNFLNQIYGTENIKHQLEGVNYFPSRLSFGQSNNFPFIDVAYGCKAYNTDSPRSRIPVGNRTEYNKYKSILKEVSPNDSGIDRTKMAVVAGWEINVNEIKNSNRCVVATIYEESKKSSNELGADDDIAVTIGLMEVNPKFPDLFD